jgi:hypothetical protein
MWRERITLADLESEHFQTQLVERLGWAVEDASAVETATRSVATGEDADAEREAADAERQAFGAYRRSASVVTTAS